MIDKAIARITEEMMKIDDPLAVMIEENLTAACTNDFVANRLLSPDKTLKEICDQIYDKAKKKANGKSGLYWPDEDVITMAKEYYGINNVSAGTGSEKIDILDLI